MPISKELAAARALPLPVSGEPTKEAGQLKASQCGTFLQSHITHDLVTI